MDLPSPDLSTRSGGQRRSTRIQAMPSTSSGSLDTSTNDTPADRSTRSTPALLSSKSTPGTSRDTPVEMKDNEEQEPTPSKRYLRRRREEPRETAPDPMEEAMKPLTDEERRSWPGWVELISDPVRYIT